jgi:hypothetical protein
MEFAAGTATGKGAAGGLTRPAATLGATGSEALDARYGTCSLRLKHMATTLLRKVWRLREHYLQQSLIKLLKCTSFDFGHVIFANFTKIFVFQIYHYICIILACDLVLLAGSI